MQIGIFAKTFEGTNPEKVLRAVADAGYITCQFNMACSGLSSLPEHITTEQIESIRSATHNTGVSITALSATYNMIHPDIEVRDRGLRSLEVLARVAKSLKIELLTLCTGSRNPDDQWAYHSDNQSSQAWADLRYAMEKALDVAEANGIFLGIEPERGNVVNSAAAARLLITEMGSSCLKVVIDPANLVSPESGAEQKAIIANAIDQVAEYIMLAHAKDRDTQGQVVAVGQGVIDFSHFIARLRNVGYGGPLITHGLAASDAYNVSKFLEGII